MPERVYKCALREGMAGCPGPKIWPRNPGKTQIFGDTKGHPGFPSLSPT